MNPQNTGADSGARQQNSSQEPRHGADNHGRRFNKPNQHDRFRQHQPNRNPFPPRPNPATEPTQPPPRSQLQPMTPPPETDTIDTTSQIIAPEQSPFVDSVTTAEAIRIYEQSGYPRSERSIQRDSASGLLTSHKSYDQNGMTYYLIDRSSIARHVDKLKSSPQPSRPPRSPGYDLSTDTRPTNLPSLARGNTAKMEMVLTQMSQRLSETMADRDVLREQLTKKDAQIDALNTQQLASTGMIQGLQRMIDALTGYLPKPPRNNE